MAATSGNKVKFTYVSTGELPATLDLDTVYFVAGVGLYVGGELIANSGLTEEDIADFGVKTVVVTGEGTAIVNAELSNTGTLTLTKGVPFTLGKGTDTEGTAQTLTPGGTFTAMTDTTVTNDSIADVNTTFTLPDAITDVETSAGTADGTVKTTVTWSNGTSTSTEAAVTGLGSAAYADTTDFATAAQGVKADNAMPATNGTATGATITLAADPTGNMDAATKGYVDTIAEGLTGAMHFIGTSTTAITDGGTEDPTIGGELVTTKESGDVVLYSGLEFVWDGSAWKELGDEGSYALKTVVITGGDGLQGGGTLAADREITHAVPTGATAGDIGSDAALTFIKKVTTDKFGHVTGATTDTVVIPEYEFADSYDASTNKGATVATVTNAINNLDVPAVGGAGSYISQISETDGRITATAGVKGEIQANNTNLVDGGTVHAAIEDVKDELAVLWTVVNS